MSKERLTEWIDNGEEKYAVPKMELRNNGHQKCCNKLAEYEDLEEQCLLLRLPVAIGTEVWTIMTGMTGKHPTLFRQRFELSMVQYWGASVFLTRKETEEKLRELEEK